MKLVRARVRLFRNILDSGDIAIDPAVTCLVGKNEAGKTAVLEAQRRLKPSDGRTGFSVHQHYPAWREKADRQKTDLDKVRPIEALLELGDDDRAAFAERFGPDVLKSHDLKLEREYGGTRRFTFDTDEAAAVNHLVACCVDLPEGIAAKASDKKDIQGIQILIEELKGDSQDPSSEAHRAADALESEVNRVLGGAPSFEQACIGFLDERVPTFFYFSEYCALPATVKIRELLEADPDDLKDEDRTALSLLRLAGADDAYLTNPDYEVRKRELENVANYLTQQVREYWSQNQRLRVDIDITQKTVKRPEGQHSVLDELKIRLYDEAHWLSLPFDERSSGFRWFFSFLAAFSEYDASDGPVVILLDEPALALHARAQRDFLRFIDERLGGRHQVIYTTHSPFMVEAGKLERVRLVQDFGPDEGTRVTSDVQTTDRDTLFPLQGALGYDLVQHLLIQQHSLIAEGISDLTYMNVMSDHLRGLGRTCLDKRWSIMPVGGADAIPTFVALLGNHLDVTVVVDARRKDHQRLSRLASEGYLKSQRIVAVGDLLGRKGADIEDLFDVDDYLEIYNLAFEKKLTATALKGTGRIVERIARAEKLKDGFHHNRPADAFLRNRDKLLPKMGNGTLDRFDLLFGKINETLNA